MTSSKTENFLNFFDIYTGPTDRYCEPLDTISDARHEAWIPVADVRTFLEHLIQLMGARFDIESRFLTAQPQIFMWDPYAILDFIRDEKILTEEEIDNALVAGQDQEEEKS